MPKRSNRRRLDEQARYSAVQAESHIPPHRDNRHQRPSNVWGVGYRLIAGYEETAATA